VGRKIGEGEKPLTGGARVTVQWCKAIQTGQMRFKSI
jgi:hypothetical protein